VIVGTKVRVPESDKGAIGKAIAAGMDASLGRLGRDSVDLFQLHNQITTTGQGTALSAQAVLDEVMPAFERLRQAGKTRFFGITATGDTAALQRIVESGAIQSAQVAHNLLNPSPGGAVPSGYPAQDYGRLLDRCLAAGIGTIGIRALAGGALSGEADRHPIASPAPEPIGSAASYDADLARARRFLPLVKDGHAGSLVELALRFVISHPGLSTMLIGIATPQQFETAADALAKGPLPPATLARIGELQQSFAGEKR
jgi:aryl-alcohol dehydrogenase-like predicted oxidoreductase